MPRRSRSAAGPGLVAAALVAFLHGAAPAADVPRLRLEPGPVRLDAADGSQQLLVTEDRPDGTQADVTRAATFRVVPETLGRVSPVGLLTAGAEGTGEIQVAYEGRTAATPLSVRPPRPGRVASFRRDVMAVLSRAGCNMGACHGNLNGKGGFRLSLRGDDPSADFLALTRDAQARRVNATTPWASLIVLKPTGRLAHEGGVRFGPDAREARSLVDWIRQGARDDGPAAPEVARLCVSPSERYLAPGRLDQQLVVTAEFADGTSRDVTREAAFDLSDPTLAEIDRDGRVAAKKAAEVTVAVRYLTGRAVSRLAFLADRPGFAWREPEARSELDRLVFQKLRRLRVQPSEPVDDAGFLRRAYLDAIGRLPEPDEARAFLADDRPDRRDRLVDALLDRPEFADQWALKWADLLRNEEKTMGEKGVWVFQRWLRDQVARDTPLDAFARSLLTATGSNWANPASSFYRTNRDPQTVAETVGQVFLGVRLQCARCHNHPFDVWTQDDYYGLAAAFGNVRRKQVNNVRRDNLDKHEINGDEVVYLEGRPGMIQPRTGADLPPRAPLGPVLDGDDARVRLANWLTRENRQFARNLANRVWFHLLGRGIVDPVDDFRDSNPPSNPELLEYLTERFIAGGYRLRPLVALIMTSQTYQLGAIPNESNADDEANFARARVRLIPAETLLDTIGQALGAVDRFDRAPAGTRATQLPGVKPGETFLRAFGKPERLLTCECERSESTTLAQAFQLINGPTVRSKLEAPDNRVGRLLAAPIGDDARLDELTLATLSRLPKASERSTFLGHVRGEADRRRAWEDVAWALINAKEFLLRH